MIERTQLRWYITELTSSNLLIDHEIAFINFIIDCKTTKNLTEAELEKLDNLYLVVQSRKGYGYA